MRNVTEEIGRWMKSKRVDGKRDIPLGSRRWTSLRKSGSWTWILETLGGCDGGGRTDVFSSKRKGVGATGNVPADRKIEIFITRVQGQNGNLILCLFGRQRFV